MVKRNSIIYTIGYEGVTAEVLVNTLSKTGIEVLVDVRAVPLSRKPGLSKNKLAARLAEKRIFYRGLKGLGTPAEGRAAARKGRTAEMRNIFFMHLATEEAKTDLAELLEIAKNKRTCLLCFEHSAETCHRLMVAERLAELADFKVQHLNPVLENL